MTFLKKISVFSSRLRRDISSTPVASSNLIYANFPFLALNWTPASRNSVIETGFRKWVGVAWSSFSPHQLGIFKCKQRNLSLPFSRERVGICAVSLGFSP
uniref:Uncharacterized protein n=1 Tax=Opuntia streptacantha TaxID=393608 RepID=A0A7C9EK88_OPUST